MVASSASDGADHARQVVDRQRLEPRLPVPVIGTTPGEIRTSPAIRLKNPSRGPNSSDGARTVQSSPLSRTIDIPFALELA